jgi:hypothetical protein
MDLYHVWCDLRPGVRDTEFAEKLNDYMAHLKAEGMIKSWRLTRRKLGLGPSVLGEFHMMIEIDGLHQLDRAFERVATRDEPTEGFHFGVNSLVCNAQFALYRDFPDTFRKRGEERF